MKALMSLSILLSFSFAFAGKIYVAPVQGTNVNKQEATTLRELIKVEVQNQAGHRVVDALEGADFYLQSKLIKLNNYTLSMTRWENNQKISSGQWKAANLAELENQIGTAVGQVLNSNAADKKAVLYENKKSLGEKAAEKKDKANFERVEARRQVTVGFGPAYFSKMNAPQSGIGFQAGYVWNIDDHFDLGLQSDFAISTDHSDAYILSGKIITNYYFARNDISPFVGAGFGYGWASVHDSELNTIPDDTAGGFAGSLQAGVKFFRTSTVNFAISGEYTHLFDKSTIGQPGVFLLKVALLY